MARHLLISSIIKLNVALVTEHPSEYGEKGLIRNCPIRVAQKMEIHHSTGAPGKNNFV